VEITRSILAGISFFDLENGTIIRPLCLFATLWNDFSSVAYASCSQLTLRAAPSFFQVLTEPDLRLVLIAAIGARDTPDFFASCTSVGLGKLAVFTPDAERKAGALGG
jgi:hypothetical protein